MVKVVLRDGTTVQIAPLTGREDPREFQRFINSFLSDGSYLLADKPVTLKEEREWLQTQVKAQRKGDLLYLKALVKKDLVGDCIAKPGFGRNKGNVSLGIAVAKAWQGKGIGRILLEELIQRVEQRWHPENIYLHVVSLNEKARSLYESLGFHIVATLPRWYDYQGKYLDEHVLVLDNKHVQAEKTVTLRRGVSQDIKKGSR